MDKETLETLYGLLSKLTPRGGHLVQKGMPSHLAWVIGRDDCLKEIERQIDILKGK